MTPDELELHLRGGACLALDTNVMFGFRELKKLHSLVRSVNRTLNPIEIRLVIPALVHAEMLHDLRCYLAERGECYRAEVVAKEVLVEIVAFKAEDGDGVSEHIFQRYSTSAQWRAAKRHNAISHLGLLAKADQIQGTNVPATVDWFIAGHARQHRWLMVTDDHGPEFEGLERVSRATLTTALERLASPGPTPDLERS